MSSQSVNTTYYSAFGAGAPSTARRWVEAALGCWTALLLAGRGEQARGVAVRALLASRMGADVDAWRLHWYGLEIHVSLWRLDAVSRQHLEQLSSGLGVATVLLGLLLARVARPSWLRILALDGALCAAWSTTLPLLGALAWQARRLGGWPRGAAVALGLGSLLWFSAWVARRSASLAFDPLLNFQNRVACLFLAWYVPLAAALLTIRAVWLRPLFHAPAPWLAALGVLALTCALAAIGAFPRPDPSRQLTPRQGIILLAVL
ncbi:MAG: hypothetical protein ACYC6M_10680, partial [Terriglobales bacterium]